MKEENLKKSILNSYIINIEQYWEIASRILTFEHTSPILLQFLDDFKILDTAGSRTYNTFRPVTLLYCSVMIPYYYSYLLFIPIGYI